MEYIILAIVHVIFYTYLKEWSIIRKHSKQVILDEEILKHPLVQAALDMAHCRERSFEDIEPAETRKMLDDFENAYQRLLVAAGDLEQYKQTTDDKNDSIEDEQPLSVGMVVNLSDYQK